MIVVCSICLVGQQWHRFQPDVDGITSEAVRPPYPARVPEGQSLPSVGHRLAHITGLAGNGEGKNLNEHFPDIANH